MTSNAPSSVVTETAAYDNLITDVENYEHGFQPEKPEKTPDFPFELSVVI